MGKTRTSVGTSVSRAIEDALIPSAIRTAIENSVLTGTEMTEYMVAGLADSMAARAHRMYDFAKAGNYTHGVPSGDFYTPAVTGEAELLRVLQDIEGPGVPLSLQYRHYGAPNNLHFGWVQLITEHGYNTATNQLADLSEIKGSPVYLEDMVVVIPASEASQQDTDSLKQWGFSPRSGHTPDRPAPAAGIRGMIPHSPVELSATATVEHLRVTYVWGTAGSLQRESLEIPVTGLSESALYFHASYLAGDELKYFFYRDGAGTYVLLDQVFDAPPTPNGSFFPFIYFRYEKVSELENKDSDSFKTSRRLMKQLGMDYEQVAEAINANPDIADVEQAMLMMAVPANTENQVERRYLWDFFNALYITQPTSTQASDPDSNLLADLIGRLSGFSNPGIAVQDKRFKLWLDNEGLYKRRVAGVLGKVGTYTSGFESSPKTREVLDPSTGAAVTITTPGAHHYYRRQVSAGFYDEILVVRMRTVFQIYGDYSSIGDEEDPILLIPLDKAITERYPMPKREELYSRSLHYVFNSRVTTKVKWYQTSWFRAVLIIVMIVVTVLTQGATAKELAALIQAGYYAAAAYIVLVKILEAVLIRAIFKVLVRALGTEFAFVVAVIAAAAGVISAMESGSVAGAPFAKDLLMLASGLASGVSDVTGDLLDALAGEFLALEDWKKAQEEVLEAGRDLLGENSRLNPFVIFGETPQEYYDRTVHSGNIGVLSITAISQFVAVSLTLPKLNDTLGEQP